MTHWTSTSAAPCRRWIACVGLALAVWGCRRERAPAREEPVAPPSETLVGNSKAFGIAIRRVLLEVTEAGVDTRFEIENQGKSIVSVASVKAAAGSEVSLAVETLHEGAWKREPSARDASAHFHDLWPGATAYARAMIPGDARWARVFVTGRGLVGKKDGVPVDGDLEVSGDAFEVPATR